MEARKNTPQKILLGACIGLASLCLALAIYQQGWLSTLENKSWDFRSKTLADAGKASKEIVLVLLDQNSLDWANETLGLNWPWPREIYGAVVSFCKRTGVKSLGFDVIYSEPSSYGISDDQAYGRELAASGNVANAVVLSRTVDRVKTWPSHLERQRFRLKRRYPLVDGMRPEQSKPFMSITLPVPEIANNSAVLCNVGLAPDRDGVYRQVPLFSVFKDQAVPTLGLGLYLAAHPHADVLLEKNRLIIDGRQIPLKDREAVILNYRGPSGAHEAYSAAWLIRSELRAREGHPLPAETLSAFKDKYVFFGFSAPGLFDIHNTPVDSQVPGVEIHATLLDNLLSGDFMARVPFWITLAFCAGITLCCGILTALYTQAQFLFSLVTFFGLLPLGAGFLAYTKGYWLPMALPFAGTGITIALSLAVNYATEGRRRRFIKTAFTHYLSPHVIDQILKNPERLRLGGERRTLSIFFSDLESFTTLSERMDPEELTRFLNQYLSAMTDIIHSHGGTIDKYEGDAIIAFWNAPLETRDHAGLAVRAALDCQAKLEEMRPDFKKWTGHWVRMRIGLNTGPAVVGNLGSNTRFDYTMIGDAVNLSARLESANKQFGTYTMVSRDTRIKAETTAIYRPLGQIRVKGKAKAVRIYEPIDERRAQVARELIPLFEQGLLSYEQGNFHEAFDIFSGMAERDPASEAYARACDTLRSSPPESWDGVWHMLTK